MSKQQREKRKKKRIRIQVNRGYGYSAANMMDMVAGNMKLEDNWIEVERHGSSFKVVNDNMTDRKGDWVVDCTELGFSQWDNEVKDLDNGWSDESQCFDMSNKLQWNEVIMTPDEFHAPNLERLIEALQHVAICAWCPGDI